MFRRLSDVQPSGLRWCGSELQSRPKALGKGIERGIVERFEQGSSESAHDAAVSRDTVGEF